MISSSFRSAGGDIEGSRADEQGGSQQRMRTTSIVVGTPRDGAMTNSTNYSLSYTRIYINDSTHRARHVNR